MVQTLASGVPTGDDDLVVHSGPGSYAIRVDERHIVRIDTVGVQSVEEVESYLNALGKIVARTRRLHGRVRVLADLRASPVRSQRAADRLRTGNMMLYRSGDRVALLVESSLLKLQLRRNIVPEYQSIFISPVAAETWLTAFDNEPGLATNG